jgi:hypothetical protein
MVIKKMIAFLYSASVLTLILGCAIGTATGSNSNSGGAMSVTGISKTGNGDLGNNIYYANRGLSSFVPGQDNPNGYQGNPLINNVKYPNSSDPALCVYTDQTSGREILMMVTSSDLKDQNPDDYGTYPMDTTYLYSTSTIDGKWYYHGAVAKINDFKASNGGWSKDYNGLWAPDIEYVEKNGSKKIYIYVPALDNSTEMNSDGKVDEINKRDRIGILTADVKSGIIWGSSGASYQMCSNFTPLNKSLTIYGHDGYDNPDPSKDKLKVEYDPGIFSVNGPSGDFYMAYCDGHAFEGKYYDGRMRLAKMRDNMTEADDLDMITFSRSTYYCDDPRDDFRGSLPYIEDGKVKNGTIYIEGPDITLWNVTGEPTLYMIFAARMHKADGNGDGITERIGYAIKKLSDFNGDNRTKDWVFKGWLFQKVKDEDDCTNPAYTNHADFIRYNGKYYVFYHKINMNQPQNGTSENRQVCVEEIFPDKSNGTIRFYDESTCSLVNVEPNTSSSYGKSLLGTEKGGFVNSLRCSWGGTSSNPVYLTLCDSGSPIPVWSQYLDWKNSPKDSGVKEPDWSSQEWVIEPAYLNLKTDKPLSQDNCVRIRSLYNNQDGNYKYLTASSKNNDNQQVTGQNLDTASDGDAQIWVLEDGYDKSGKADGTKKLRCYWSRYGSDGATYLTIDNDKSGAMVKTHTLGKNSDGSEWGSQRWWIY